MSYEFKKLSDVELLEEVPEGANALIEADGVICKVPGSNLGGGNSIPTAILESDLSADSDGFYSATCKNMTYDEVKAIFKSGGSVNARLLSPPGMEGGWFVQDSISIISSYVDRADAGVELVQFLFYATLQEPITPLFFYWGPTGVISTSGDKALGWGLPT